MAAERKSRSRVSRCPPAASALSDAPDEDMEPERPEVSERYGKMPIAKYGPPPGMQQYWPHNQRATKGQDPAPGQARGRDPAPRQTMGRGPAPRSEAMEQDTAPCPRASTTQDVCMTEAEDPRTKAAQAEEAREDDRW